MTTPASDPENPPARQSEHVWLSTAEAARHMGITARTLYRFIDEGQVPAYRMGRVIRLKKSEVDAFIEKCRIAPGTLDHLYPEPVGVDPKNRGHRPD